LPPTDLLREIVPNRRNVLSDTLNGRLARFRVNLKTQYGPHIAWKAAWRVEEKQVSVLLTTLPTQFG
jgi:hypothetical protein